MMAKLIGQVTDQGRSGGAKAAMRALATLALLLGMLGSVGCGQSGALTVRSELDPENKLEGDFTTAIYGFQDQHTLNILLVEGNIKQVQQAVHIRMFWRPVAGATPVDRNSINTTVRYLIFTGPDVGVYDGAGFMLPSTKPGAQTMKATIQEAALRLQDSSVNFKDRLGLAKMAGNITVRRDEAMTQKVLEDLQKKVAERLGYRRFVYKE